MGTIADFRDTDDSTSGSKKTRAEILSLALSARLRSMPGLSEADRATLEIRLPQQSNPMIASNLNVPERSLNGASLLTYSCVEQTLCHDRKVQSNAHTIAANHETRHLTDD